MDGRAFFGVVFVPTTYYKPIYENNLTRLINLLNYWMIRELIREKYIKDRIKQPAVIDH